MSRDQVPLFDTRARGIFAAVKRAFDRYAAWLVSLSWKRFLMLSLLLMIFSGILQSLPPFTWRTTQTIVDSDEPKRSAKRSEPVVKVEKGKGDQSVVITVGGKRIRVSENKPDAASEPAGAPSQVAPATTPSDPATPMVPPAPPAAGTATAPAAPAAAVATSRLDVKREDITINVPNLPAGVDANEVRAAIEAARDAVAEAIRDARDAATDGGDSGPGPRRIRTTTTSLGEALPEMAFLWILGSAIIKFAYKGQMRAEAQAAVATETAEAETLKRQVVEARMAAMQAQVEPHFLFNTLGSIDHLIETDPPRASKMQKNLIALLRASMPTMRESNSSGLRDLGAEIGVIQPYLEILKVRMEDRLDAHVDVPEGLKSAAFPPMMLQSLVENAIKHGLEPKAEGGSLRVKAEIVHGRLVVSVADTGLGFGRAATAGTGVGLVNVRERLKLLFGDQAKLLMTANEPSGTVATITVPYRSLDLAA